MKKSKRIICNYLEDLLMNKGKILAGAMVFVILYVITLHYMFDGINKKFIIYSVLCLFSGIFVAIPRIRSWIFNLVLLVLYLLYVPGKMFQRIEAPLTDMTEILPGVHFATVMLILLVFAICLLLLQRVRFALPAGSIFLCVLFLINYYVVQFRGSTLGINDLTAAGTGLSVMNNYSLTIGAEQWYSILYFIFFALWGSWIDLPWRGRLYHTCVTAAAVCFVACSIYFWKYSGYYEKYAFQGYYWNTSYNERLNGFLLSFYVSIRENTMKKPEGYSEKTLLELAGEAEERYDAEHASDTGDAPVSPNIIMIMNEAWSDLRVMGNLETSQEFMPFVNALTENAVQGNLYVEILGGLTANTEFESITGDSLAFLSATVVPYQAQVNHDISAMSDLLKRQGYSTMAMHPSGAGAWNRNKVYQHFGFDEFIVAEDFVTDYEYVGSMISDRCNFNEIIYRYEHRDKEKPFFLFDVTIQNHASYYNQTPNTVLVERVGETTDLGDRTQEVNCYLSLMKLTDDAFRDFIAYFEKVDEPTIICMYGDHQPLLSDQFYNAIYADGHLSEEEQISGKYITKYVIWANYDVDWKDYGDISANYLRSMVLECAGVKLSPYDKFLLNLREDYPIITHFTIDEFAEDEEIQKYQMLEYNHLIEKKYLKELF